MRLLALIALLVASPALAQQVELGPPGMQTAAGTVATRTTYICIVPDIQNLTSVVNDQVGSSANTTCSCGTGATNCSTSPWCSGSWRETNATILRNMAYELTGQWSRIAWPFTGPVPARAVGSIANPTNGVPRKCDLVVQVGDIGDSGHPFDSTIGYANLTQQIKDEWIIAQRDFFEILRQAGVPFIAAQGNHDAPNAYLNYFTEALVQSLPGYYAEDYPNSISWAIKASTPAGEICAVMYGCRASLAALDFAYANVGCGDDLPTIVVSHAGGWGIATFVEDTDDACDEGGAAAYTYSGVTSAGATGTGDENTATLAVHAGIQDYHIEGQLFSITIDGTPQGCTIGDYNEGTRVATMDSDCGSFSAAPDADDPYSIAVSPGPALLHRADTEVTFINAFGHYTTNDEACHPCGTEITPTDNLGRTEPYILIDENWQEIDRISSALGAPYGSSASDGMGGFYTIVTIDPERDRITVRPWSTLLQSPLPSPLSGLAATWHQPRTISFDWCTRFLGGAC